MSEGDFEESKKLTLADFDKIWTMFCFLDESGSLNDKTAPFFTVGLLKCSQPYYLASKIIYERQVQNFYDEMKFNKLSHHNLNFAKKVLDLFFSTRSLHFQSYTVDKEGSYFLREFSGDPWKAYEDIAVRLIKSSLRFNEILIVVADYVTTPRDVRFEVNVKRRMNQDVGRLSVAGVSRFDSRSNDLLQLVDLIIGAINYDLKITTGLVKSGDKYKRQLAEYLKANLGTPDFVHGFKNYMFNAFVDKDIMHRLPFDYRETKNGSENEKGPSS